MCRLLFSLQLVSCAALDQTFILFSQFVRLPMISIIIFYEFIGLMSKILDLDQSLSSLQLLFFVVWFFLFIYKNNAER